MHLERTYNIRLPLLYKKFLYKYNGGYTPKTTFKTGKLSSDIRGFFGVGDIELSVENIDMDKWIENKVFPIACDSFGNYIVIGLTGENTGKIYFCDHENGWKKELVSKDLISFLGCCKSEKISENARRSIKEREEALVAKGKGNNITDGLRKMWQEEIDKYSNIIQEEVLIEN